MKYVCSVCGYEYDPAENDNVPFDQLPDDWTCPVCGVSKDQFRTGLSPVSSALSVCPAALRQGRLVYALCGILTVNNIP